MTAKSVVLANTISTIPPGRRRQARSYGLLAMSQPNTVAYDALQRSRRGLLTGSIRSLYRRCLKLSLDWCVHRHIWRGQALYIRSLFEANKNVREPRQRRVRVFKYRFCIHTDRHRKALFEETQAILEKWKHPDPYRPPTAPGGISWISLLVFKYLHELLGSKYERNLPAHVIDRTQTSAPARYPY